MPPLVKTAPQGMAVPDHQIGQSIFAINFIARPEGAFLQEMAQMQDALATELPEGVFKCPLKSLHLTVVPIIWARGSYNFDVRKWWSENTVAVQADIAQATIESKPMTLTCAGVDVLPGAIVVRFEPNDVLNALRQNTHASHSVTDIIVEKVDFTHVTVFRFEQELPLSGISEIVNRSAVPKTPWAIDHLTLCQETTYPSLQYTDIAKFEFAPRLDP